MPKRQYKKSKRRQYTPDDIMQLASTIADLTPVVGDAKAVYEVTQALKAGDYKEAAIGTGLAAIGMIPVAGDAAAASIKAGRRARDWADVPLKSNSVGGRTSQMREQFLGQHGFRELAPGEAPGPDTFRYRDDGKIEAFSGGVDQMGNQMLSTKTFGEESTLKTLRNWMGY